MDTKNKILIIVLIALVIAIGSFIYLTYIADQTYEDERISITVPAGTQFKMKAEDAGSGFSRITYNDTSDKNIVIRMINTPDTTLFGVSAKDITIKSQENGLINESYKSVKITENYTIYKNEETGRYNVLIDNPGFNGYILIGCNGDLEDIVKLADSFKFKSYTTEGLIVETVDTSNITDNSTNTSTTNSNPTPTKKTTENSKKDKYDQYVEDAINDPRGDGTKNTAMSEKEFYESGQDKYY